MMLLGAEFDPKTWAKVGAQGVMVALVVFLTVTVVSDLKTAVAVTADRLVLHEMARETMMTALSSKMDKMIAEQSTTNTLLRNANQYQQVLCFAAATDAAGRALCRDISR